MLTETLSLIEHLLVATAADVDDLRRQLAPRALRYLRESPSRRSRLEAIIGSCVARLERAVEVLREERGAVQ